MPMVLMTSHATGAKEKQTGKSFSGNFNLVLELLIPTEVKMCKTIGIIIMK